MSCFIYRSLTPHKKRIRLLNVLPEAHRPLGETTFVQQPVLDPSNTIIGHNLVCCTISHASLDNAPPYTALSYNWGDQNRMCEILLNGATISITENLETALRHLRQRDKPLIMWIDALCIDQTDNAEKSEQIEQMQQIYARASSVTTWLGPAANNSDVAMRWIQRYGGWAFELDIGSRPELQLRHLLEKVDSGGQGSVEGRLQTFIQDLKVQLSQDGAEHITALDMLFKRPYWSRVWVVQELVSASQMLFVCGTEKVKEEALHHSLRLLRNFRRYQLLKVGQEKLPSEPKGTSVISIDTHDPIVLLKLRRAASLFPLVYLLRSLRAFGATDPRDKALGLHPDYGKSCEEVYSEVALTLIQNGYYDPLSLSGLSEQATGLPSWIPDWSVKSGRKTLQERSLDRSTFPLTAILEPKFSASGIEGMLDLPGRGRIIRNIPLLLHGAVLGTVGQIGMVWENGGVSVWLQDLDRLSYLAKGTFETTEERQKTVWRTAVADQEIRQGKKKPRLSKGKLSSVHEALKDNDLSLTQVQTLVEAGLGDYYEQLQVFAPGRRPLCTSGGYFGIGPYEAQAGDVLAILLRPQVPYILRRNNEDNTFRLVGEAYVHGVMDGEAIKDFPATEMISLV